jgi:hypothetical protein
MYPYSKYKQIEQHPRIDKETHKLFCTGTKMLYGTLVVVDAAFQIMKVCYDVICFSIPFTKTKGGAILLENPSIVAWATSLSFVHSKQCALSLQYLITQNAEGGDKV